MTCALDTPRQYTLDPTRSNVPAYIYADCVPSSVNVKHNALARMQTVCLHLII